MVPEPDALLHVLRLRHVPGLTRRQLQVLALCQLGYPVDDIGELLFLAAPTVRRHLAELESRILGPTGLPGTHILLARWTREHEDCCVRSIVQMIKDRELIERGDRPRRHG